MEESDKGRIELHPTAEKDSEGPDESWALKRFESPGEIQAPDDRGSLRDVLLTCNDWSMGVPVVSRKLVHASILSFKGFFFIFGCKAETT